MSEKFNKIYEKSIKNPENFWQEASNDILNLSKQTYRNTFSLFPLYSNNFWVQTKLLKIPYASIKSIQYYN